MASAESARSGGGGSSSAAGAQEACAQGTPGCCSDAWCSEQRKGPVCNRCATEVDGVLDPDEYVCACKHQTETELYEGALDDAIWCALDNHGLRPLNAAEGGEVVLNIGARRNKLDVYSWVGHELVELALRAVAACGLEEERGVLLLQAISLLTHTADASCPAGGCRRRVVQPTSSRAPTDTGSRRVAADMWVSARD